MVNRAITWSFGIFILSLFLACAPKGDEVKAFKTVVFESADQVKITADVYESLNHDKDTSPIILLFHQARFSRGEYREIAPKLTELGYTCIAIDQRSGDAVNGVVNQTHLEAEKLNLPTKYVHAYPDLDAAVQYTKKQYPNRKIIIWGSSYSSSLVFILGANYPDAVAGILSFSPGEYFKYHNNSVENYAREVTCPAFITSAKDEQKSWESIFEALPNAKKQSFLPTGDGYHGSKALWSQNEGNEEYWQAVKTFLKSL